jgi:hypothetical protein
MKPRYINLILIILGGGIAIYAEAGEQQNVYILISGLLVLMIGLYRFSKQIPDKEPIDKSENKNEEK